MNHNQSQKNVTNSWQKKEVGEIFDFIKTYAISRDNLVNGTDNIKGIGNIHYGDLHATYNSTIIDLKKISVPLVKDHKFKPYSKDFLADGDLVMADVSEDYDGIGVTVLVHGLEDKKVVGGLHTFVLRDNKGVTNEKYRQFIFCNPIVRNKLQKIANGVSVYGISKTSLSKFIIDIPPLPEQKRIVSVLETWDSAIEKLARYIEVKKNIKKSLMQKLLSGKVRLPGFSEKWQTMKLGQVGEIVTGNTPPMKDIENYGNEFCWATAEDFNSKYIFDTNIKLSETGKSKSRFLPKGSVLVTCIASLGKNAIAGVPLATNQQINAVIVNSENNNEFIYYLIENSNNLLRRSAGAGAMPILNKSGFASLKINLPHKDEQVAIADILTKSDKEIELLQDKLNKIRELKKYLLNNLITGKIRIPENI